MNKNFNITPDWISGFTQSDGSFVISFMSKKIGMPIRPVPIFNITQSKIEFDLFIEINKKLGIGTFALAQKQEKSITIDKT